MKDPNLSTIKTDEEIGKIYERLSSPDGLLFHVAHARKENCGDEYDGERLKRIAKGRVKGDVDMLNKATEALRSRSIPRPKS